ncbi:MAG: prepilin-type N-terminal cleavage/methylation domain-containing protein [Armatimonadetes bacterium]|nr:prepilin-type N-terminal cleavage/methylation domain-containing protein [Armatimonadota bacterium]
MKNNKRKAFTLVEIMIVVLIIGILMAIAVPNFVTARNTSRMNTCIANLKQIDSAKEQWAMDNKKDQGAAVAWTDLIPAGGGGYIKSQPSCPSGGTYAINVVGTNPTCTTANHVLP